MRIRPQFIIAPLVPLALLAGCAPASTGGSPAVETPGRMDTYRVPALPAPRPVAAEEYAARRRALAGRMSDGVFIAIGAPAPEHDYLPFSQTPGFLYLTGITEPGAALVISKTGGAVTERLYVMPRDPSREVWEGPRLGADGAEARTGVESSTIDDLEADLEGLLSTEKRLYALTTGRRPADLLLAPSYEQRVIAAISERYDLPVTSLQAELAGLRGVKSPTELDLIRRAVAITTLAHRDAMRTVAPGMNEFEIHSLIEHDFRRHGADRPAFASIVGSGPNATTLHYNANDRYMNASDMLVMDIGASYRGYAADITRSVPVDGRFSPEQRAVYEVVLAAQKSAESLARPGATWQTLVMAAQAEIGRGLAKLGLIEGADAVFDCGAGRACPQLRLFFMHGLGHGIGLQVHDPDAADTGVFGIGSAFTIEPGIYVRPDALDHIPDTPRNRRLRSALAPAVARYRNIGVRIEDDYIITESGAERISAGAPREIDEIEALMALPGVGAADRRPEIVEWYRRTTPGS